MRILMVHNRYQIRGGEDEVCDAERRLLQAYGHEVDLYEEHNDRLAELNPIQTAVNTVWSRHTYREACKQLSQKSYDIVHVHNFLPLISPSIFYAAKDQNVPVVQTLHNYRLLCANALFFREGKICEDCLGATAPLAGVYHSCYRGSRTATGVVSAMNSVHHWMKTWSSMIDVYIALTEFARQKYIEGGIPEIKIRVKPNFVDPDPGVGEGQGNYALYVGRLSVEKGLDTLLDAWQMMKDCPPLKIVGDGPLTDMVVQAMKQNPSIELLGRKSMAEVHELMGNAMMLIFPSKWYETFGRVAIEAFSKGTPVVAANIGAIAELIDAGRTGLLFEPSNPHSLAVQVESMLAHPVRTIDMRQETRKEYEVKYTASSNYQQMLGIYNSLM